MASITFERIAIVAGTLAAVAHATIDANQPVMAPRIERHGSASATSRCTLPTTFGSG